MNLIIKVDVFIEKTKKLKQALKCNNIDRIM